MLKVNTQVDRQIKMSKNYKLKIINKLTVSCEYTYAELHIDAQI